LRNRNERFQRIEIIANGDAKGGLRASFFFVKIPAIAADLTDQRPGNKGLEKEYLTKIVLLSLNLTQQLSVFTLTEVKAYLSKERR
jgi:hypothetical protein